MENENLENKAGHVRRNPSRDNKNINQGQNYEKRVDSENHSNRNAETDKKKFAGNENVVDDSEVSYSTGDNTDYGFAGKTQQNAKGKDTDHEQSVESSGRVKNDQAQKAGGVSSYDANEQFDNDEDYGSHQDTKSSATGGQKKQVGPKQKDKILDNSARQ